MNPIRCTPLAAAVLLTAACEKHADPIGTVPANDVPAVPVGTAPSGEPTTGDASDCERETGAEREACLRRYPPNRTSPVEPEKTSPPSGD